MNAKIYMNVNATTVEINRLTSTNRISQYSNGIMGASSTTCSGRKKLLPHSDSAISTLTTMAVVGFFLKMPNTELIKNYEFLKYAGEVIRTITLLTFQDSLNHRLRAHHTVGSLGNHNALRAFNHIIRYNHIAAHG